MTIETPATCFAPSTRSGGREIQEHHEALSHLAHLRELVDAIPSMVAILDPNRQIVLANRSLVTKLGRGDIATVLGLRPGEGLNCRHASEVAGCGTSKACRECGAVLAILGAQQGRSEVKECQVSSRDGCALDLRVTVKPLEFEAGRYSVMTLQDISDEKRRQVLERTFFHDILNSAGGIQGLSGILAEDEGNRAENAELVLMLKQAVDQLVDEIEAQRDLLAAERGDLVVESERTSTGEVLRLTVALFDQHPVGRDRTVEVDPASVETTIEASRPLIIRVVSNMLKNALEASPAGGRVRLGCRCVDSGVEFWVWNPGAIAKDVQLQLFKRSFSTKGSGRGIGTYSMKLLAERYLQGRIAFTSNEREGTTFRVTLPLATSQ